MGKRFYFLDSAPFDERTNEQYGQYISGHTHIMFLDKKKKTKAKHSSCCCFLFIEVVGVVLNTYLIEKKSDEASLVCCLFFSCDECTHRLFPLLPLKEIPFNQPKIVQLKYSSIELRLLFLHLFLQSCLPSSSYSRKFMRRSKACRLFS